MAGSGEDSLLPGGLGYDEATGRCARDSDWCDGYVCREHGLDCPNAEGRESGGEILGDPDEPPGPEYMGSFSQLSSVNPERPPTGEFSASPTLGSARREQARYRRADFRRGLRLMAGLFLIVAIAAFVAGMLVGSIMEAVQ